MVSNKSPRRTRLKGGRLVNGSGTGNVLYYVTDHLGSVRVVKDGSGTIRQRFDYYPFGAADRFDLW